MIYVLTESKLRPKTGLKQNKLRTLDMAQTAPEPSSKSKVMSKKRPTNVEKLKPSVSNS